MVEHRVGYSDTSFHHRKGQLLPLREAIGLPFFGMCDLTLMSPAGAPKPCGFALVLKAGGATAVGALGGAGFTGAAATGTGAGAGAGTKGLWGARTGERCN